MNPVNQNAVYTLENLWAKTQVNTRSSYLILILLLISLFVSLPFISVDISAQSRGIVRSAYENVPITNMVASRILSVHFKQNQQVKKGDTLVVLDPDILQMEAQEVNKQVAQNRRDLVDLTRAMRGVDLSFDETAMQADYAHYLAQLHELHEKEQQAEINLKRNQLLYDTRVIPPLEFEQFEHALREVRNQVAVLSKKQISLWEHRRRELELSQQAQMANLRKIELEQKRYVLIAPVSGTIVNYKGYTAGTFINNAHVIAEISPNQQLLVECLVATSDVGLIHPTQRVRFQMDAYNYNYWGFVEGEVQDIDQQVSPQHDQLFVKVRCKLNRMHLKLKNGYQAGIRKGMTLSAHFIITRRSLYQLLYDHVDAWMNPITNGQKS
jgi:multidrug resistance efflux pump